MWNWIHLYTFALALLLGVVFTGRARRLARRWNVLDQPGERKLQREPKPLLGGVAIYLAFALTIFVNLGLVWIILHTPALARLFPTAIIESLEGVKVTLGRLTALLGGGVLLLGLGLVDDLRGLRPGVKLLGQIIAASLVVLLGTRITFFVDNVYFQCLITVVWIVAVSNAFNLMDNMDGLAGGVALIASLLFFLVARGGGQLFVSAVLAAFAGTLLAFLFYNFHPATIFMGDAGSMFIGYMMAGLTVMSTYYYEGEPSPLAVFMPLLILGVPIFDTASVIYLRLRSRQSIFVADQRHLSHRLLSLGMTQRQAVTVVYLLTFSVGLGATLLRVVGKEGVLIILLQGISIIALIVCLENAARRTNG